MKYKTLGVLAGTLFAVTAFAGEMKPGLWEMTAQSPAFSGMQEQMAKMSPAERKQMEAIMAQQNVKMNDAGMTSKVCITPEMAKRDAVPVQQQDNCTQKISPRVGNTVKLSYTCATQPPTSGEGEITFQSDTAYSMKMRTVHGGQNTDMQASGRWLGADCGNVKPIPQSPGK